MDWTRRLRLQHLQLLVSLMETGNLSGTARAAHTTQPGLSKWLKELEEEVGAPLFERHARGLRPTPYGMTLFNHAQRVLTEMERARQNLEAMRSGSGSRVLLGTSPASAPSLVPRALRAFLGRYPGAQVELLEGTMNGLLERLEKRQLDVVVGRLDNYAPRASLRCEVLYSEAIVVMARPGHPLAQAAALDWEDVRRYDWIVWPPGSPIRSKLDMALTQGGRQPPAYRLESSSMLANIELLRGSDMLSIGSARVVEHLAGLGLVARLALEIPGEGAVGMCWRDEPHRDRASEDLLACLREGAAAE
ncbi:LysR family transcriptional regulator [Pseudomonas aeruginosa]|nr:LysR family transcriptional regulator [Pseudomonas aeruginosa]MCU9297345.1 LysR family transcriptional regulator [Pseudomonas aeruginosa]